MGGIGVYDLVIPVTQAGVSAISAEQTCSLISLFSVLCAAGSVWSYQILDGDGFQIAASQNPITGPCPVAVNSRTANFVFVILNASVDTYKVRVYGG